MSTWESEEAPPTNKLGAVNYIFFVLRAAYFALCMLLYIICLIPIRGAEKLGHGAYRPWSPHIARYGYRLILWGLGFRYKTHGTPMPQPGALVANHISWIDVIMINAHVPLFFIAKSEVAKWPVIGALAKIMGTFFVKRDPKEAKKQQLELQKRLALGQKTVFFPEGTTTDGQRIITFKSSLFQAFLDPAYRDHLYIQPVALIYHAPPGKDPRFYAWWGEMTFLKSIVSVFGTTKHGLFEIFFLEPVGLQNIENRKILAKSIEERIREAQERARLNHSAASQADQV